MIYIKIISKVDYQNIVLAKPVTLFLYNSSLGSLHFFFNVFESSLLSSF